VKPHSKGLLFAALAVLCISPDTLLIRLGGEGYWVTLFWRSLFTFIGLILLIVSMNGRKTGKSIKSLGKPGLYVALLFSISNFSFLAAIQLTTVANTLVIITTTPVFAALFGYIYLSEQIAKRTWVTTTVVILTIGFIFAEGLSDGLNLGNLSALLSALSLSAAFVATRHAGDIDMTPAMAGSALISVVISFIIATSLVIPWQSFFIFISLGGFLTLAFSLLFIAPRYISAAEVSLLMPMETVLGTALVWLYIGEEPSIRTIIGGGVIIAVLSINSVIGIRQSSPN
jgi:drug/metabolite transporter (DMT)-like permease